MKGKLVYSTRWNDPQELEKLTVEIVITNEAREERLEALSKRPGLTAFLKREVRSHVAV